MSWLSFLWFPYALFWGVWQMTMPWGTTFFADSMEIITKLLVCPRMTWPTWPWCFYPADELSCKFEFIMDKSWLSSSAENPKCWILFLDGLVSNSWVVWQAWRFSSMTSLAREFDPSLLLLCDDYIWPIKLCSFSLDLKNIGEESSWTSWMFVCVVYFVVLNRWLWLRGVGR